MSEINGFIGNKSVGWREMVLSDEVDHSQLFCRRAELSSFTKKTKTTKNENSFQEVPTSFKNSQKFNRQVF